MSQNKNDIKAEVLKKRLPEREETGKKTRPVVNRGRGGAITKKEGERERNSGKLALYSTRKT